MFGLGTGEIVIILVLALILLGPAKLPEAAKSIGKGLRQISRATDDVKRQMQSAIYEEELKSKPSIAPARAPEAAAETAPPPGVPAGGVPFPSAVAEPASSDNVPGLEAALAEPAPRPAVPSGQAPEAPAEAAPKA